MQNLSIPQDNIERQVKQVMRENYASLVTDVYNSCRKKIKDEYNFSCSLILKFHQLILLKVSIY